MNAMSASLLARTWLLLFESAVYLSELGDNVYRDYGKINKKLSSE